jgi:hypothetical protein
MLQRVRLTQALLATLVALSFGLIGVLASVGVAQASTAPCVWHRSAKNIRCEYDPIHYYSYIEIKKSTASEEVEYSGGVLYYVFCTGEYSCEWSRIV